MRNSRLFALLATVGLTLLIAGAVPAAEAAETVEAPTAPYDAFTLNGAAGSWLLGIGEYSFDSSNATIGASYSPSAPNIQFAMNTPGFVHWWDALVAPPTGSTFTLETVYPISRFGDASHARFDLFGDGRGCNATTGSVVVHELTEDPTTHALTAFAATYSENCEGTMPAVSGELRWHSSVDYKAVVTGPTSLAFGNVAINQDSSPQTLTLTGKGSLPVTLGAASLTGAGAGSFVITSDGCNGLSLAYDETCTVVVTAHPTALGTSQANLVVPDDTVATHRVVPLSVTGLLATSVTVNPSSLSFGTVQLEQTSFPQMVTFTSTGANPITFGDTTIEGAAPENFTVTADACAGATLSTGQSCIVTVTATPQQQGLHQAELTLPFDVSDVVTVPLSVTGGPDPIGTYYPVPPARIMDTRSGLGAPKAPIGPGGVVHLQVAGRGGVPASGASAVVLNVTVTGPTTSSFLTIYPTGVTRPGASSLNFVKGWTGANSVTVSLGTNGKVDIYNSNGSVQVIVDVTGFYGGSRSLLAGPGMGGEYQPAVTERMLDTRSWGFGPVPPGYAVLLPVDFGSEVNSHIRALAVNITAVSPTRAGYLTAWNGDGVLPGSSTLNFPAGATAVPNLAIVPVTPCTASPSCAGLPQIGVYNGSSGSTHFLVDLFGLFDDGGLGFGLRFQPLTPTRIVDSRIGLGTPGALGPATEVGLNAPFPVADVDTAALALNVTAVNPTVGTYLTVWPTGPRPTVSNLNPAKGQTVPNAVMGELDLFNNFRVYNHAGSVHLLVDVVGTFVFGPDFYAGISASADPTGRLHLGSRRLNPTRQLPRPTVAAPG